MGTLKKAGSYLLHCPERALVAHGASQGVGFSGTETGYGYRSPEHLLLKEDNPKSLLKDRF